MQVTKINKVLTYISDVCDKGKYRKPDQKRGCYPCDEGSYQPDAGKTSCIECPDNKITLETGQSSEDACVRKYNVLV